MCFFFFFQKYFVPTKRQISRMKCRLRAPITSHLGEVLTGTSVIRAFSKEPKVTLQSGEKVDKFHELEFIDFAIERYLNVKLTFFISPIYFIFNVTFYDCLLIVARLSSSR